MSRAKKFRPAYLTEAQLDALPTGSIVHSSYSSYKRVAKASWPTPTSAWRPCSAETGRCLPKSDSYPSFSLAVHGVSL